MIDLLIHIGYHKTATTWLQTCLFNNDTLGFTRTHVKHDVPAPIVIPHAFDFDAAVCRAHFAPALHQARQAHRLPVLSHERLSGEIHTGGADSKEIADRLYATFPQAHILIIIREQKAILRSIYGQFIKGSGVWPLQAYLTPPIVAKKRFKYALPHLDHFRYHRLIRYYQQLFGPQHVTVLPYELFRQSPSTFVNHILQAADLPAPPDTLRTLPYDKQVNPSLSAIGLQVKRWLNRTIGQRTPFNTTPLFPLADPKKQLRTLAFKIDNHLPVQWKKAANQRMAQQIETTIADYYIESNRQTTELIDFDLAYWGYDC